MLQFLCLNWVARKVKKNYRFKPEFNLMKILWEEIEKREFIVEGYIGIVVTIMNMKQVKRFINIII